MHLQALDLHDFKSHASGAWEFSPSINSIVGANGVGKTNLLDAIHHLCLGKSAFNKTDQQNIRHQSPFYRVRGKFWLEEGRTEMVLCAYEATKKKTLKLGGKAYERISDHLGYMPVVLMAPNDSDLVREGSEVRRRYFDSILGQLDKPYLQALIRYQTALKQRNALLKQFATLNFFDQDLLLPYDSILINLGEKIAQKRQESLELFIPTFQEHYKALSQEREQVSLSYSSDVLSKDFEAVFKDAQAKDLDLRYTTKGIHRDDYQFTIGGYPLKKFGSQGQQKSFVVALKLAQFDFMHQLTGRKPLLLMDDIFDKLDEQRMEQLLHLLAQAHFGQVFLTDARPERTQALIKPLNTEVKIFELGGE